MPFISRYFLSKASKVCQPWLNEMKKKMKLLREERFCPQLQPAWLNWTKIVIYMLKFSHRWAQNTKTKTKMQKGKKRS